MNNMKSRCFLVWGAIFIFTFSLTGCSVLKKSKTSNSSGTKATSNNEVAPVYYDFNDVLVPGELKIVKKSTLVVQSSDFISGILTLKGRVETNSLLSWLWRIICNGGYKL
ncbi:MAG: hypothetical protein B6I31_01660 [Desulfobacteraceae bacterium 4572_19]|nr:MAG: hypothetical protein B6I31_01660 [Desulfobacteraceae bacterium 4572_19]